MDAEKGFLVLSPDARIEMKSLRQIPDIENQITGEISCYKGIPTIGVTTKIPYDSSIGIWCAKSFEENFSPKDFNALATVLCDTPVYGNAVFTFGTARDGIKGFSIGEGMLVYDWLNELKLMNQGYLNNLQKAMTGEIGKESEEFERE